MSLIPRSEKILAPPMQMTIEAAQTTTIYRTANAIGVLTPIPTVSNNTTIPTILETATTDTTVPPKNSTNKNIVIDLLIQILSNPALFITLITLGETIGLLFLREHVSRKMGEQASIWEMFGYLLNPKVREQIRMNSQIAGDQIAGLKEQLRQKDRLIRSLRNKLAHQETQQD
jgi:hypothetical protein